MFETLRNLFGGRRREPTGEGARTSRGDGRITFRLEWPTAVPGRTAELEGAALFLTDVEALKGSDVRELSLATTRGGRTPLVVVAPGFDEGARQRVVSEGLFAVLARGLGVERLDELLQDAAMLTGARVFSVALGAGMPGATTPGGLVIPGMGWSDVTPDDLGRADSASVGEEGFTIRTRPRAESDVERWTRSLASQFQMAISDADRESIARRFARFGRSVEERPAFRPDDVFGSDAISLRAGYSSAYFATDAERCVADVREARLLLLEFELTETEHAVRILETALEHGLVPTVVMATRIGAGALALLTVNKLRGILPVLGVDSGARSGEAQESFVRLAAATGASRIIHPGMLGSITPADWGRASRVMAGRSWTIVSP